MHGLHTSVALVLVLALAACGGGGTKLIALNTTNGLEAAAECSNVMPFVIDLGDLAAAYVYTIEGAPLPVCEAGDFSIDKDDRAPVGEISAGDRLVVTFQACYFEFQGGLARFDGSMTLVVQEVVDNPPGWSARFSAAIHDLSVLLDPDTVVLNGSFEVDVSTPDDITYTTVATGNLSAVTTLQGRTNYTELGGFRLASTYNGDTDQWSTSLDGRFEESELGGAVEMETVTAFTGVGDNPPSAGELVVRGSGGSQVRFLVLDDVNVRIFIDENGDGVSEQTINTTWDNL